MEPTSKIRFESFSDGVFAIAITLLALGLHIPLLTQTSFTGSIVELRPLVPSILTFVLSFITIAIFWVNHHQLTQPLNVIHKRRILWSNILFLLFLTLIPFATSAISTNPKASLAVFMYSLVLFGGSVSFGIVRYFIHKMLGETKVPMKRSAVGPIMYGGAVIASMFTVGVAYVLLAIPAFFYFLPKSTQRSSS